MKRTLGILALYAAPLLAQAQHHTHPTTKDDGNIGAVGGAPGVRATVKASAPAACDSTTILHAAPNGSGDGNSWDQPAALQQALARANGDADLGHCYEIRLRQGIYKPGPAGQPELHFAINRPMQIKGGYTGNAAQPNERVLHASNTVLSGDIGGDDAVNAQGITEVASFSTDGSTPLPGNQHVGINSYHVVVIGGAVDDSNGNGIYTAAEGDAHFTLLEGLTITAGGTSVDWWTIPEFDSQGSGLLCNGAGAGHECSPALRHLRFSGNYGWAGGALFNNGQRSGNSSPVITGTTFSGNWVAQWGGAMLNNATSSGTSNPNVTNSTFSGNHAILDGAAIYSDGGGARPTVGYSTLSGNAVMDPTTGSILYGRSNMSASIVWNNTGKPIGGTGAIVTNSLVQGGHAGAGNLNVDPQLGPLQDNGGATPTQLPASGSPAMDAVDCAAAPATDQRGVVRPQGSRCDLGAVEVAQRVDGACGAAQGQATLTPPIADLCSAGQPGVMQSAGGQYRWTCAGTQGGAYAACTAPWSPAGGTGARASLDLPVPGQNNGWSLVDTRVAPTLPAPLPPGARSAFLPLQLRLSGGTAAQAQVIVHYSAPVPEGAVYLKYGPSPEGLNCTGAACNEAHWYALPDAEFSPDRMSVRLLLTDGGAGDSDGARDGHITDPGMPVLLAASGTPLAVPTLSSWGLLLLTLLATRVGWPSLCRRLSTQQCSRPAPPARFPCTWSSCRRRFRAWS